MPKISKVAALALVFAASFSGPAVAEERVFKNPKYKSLALDWCKSWATDCGKPAADAWCVKQGYESASAFSIAEDLGEPTRIISTNQICDQPDCDSFTKITCQKADVGGDDESEVVRFKKPMAGSRRLDWCLTWATNCGKPAADYFCTIKGYDNAVDFKIAEDIGRTRILKTGQKCTLPMCDGFKYIDCE